MIKCHQHLSGLHKHGRTVVGALPSQLSAKNIFWSIFLLYFTTIATTASVLSTPIRLVVSKTLLLLHHPYYQTYTSSCISMPRLFDYLMREIKCYVTTACSRLCTTQIHGSDVYKSMSHYFPLPFSTLVLGYSSYNRIFDPHSKCNEWKIVTNSKCAHCWLYRRVHLCWTDHYKRSKINK